MRLCRRVGAKGNDAWDATAQGRAVPSQGRATHSGRQSPNNP